LGGRWEGLTRVQLQGCRHRGRRGALYLCCVSGRRGPRGLPERRKARWGHPGR
jgi:hypothetical protein